MSKRMLIVLWIIVLSAVSMVLVALTDLQTAGYILSGIGLILAVREVISTDRNAWWNN